MTKKTPEQILMEMRTTRASVLHHAWHTIEAREGEYAPLPPDFHPPGGGAGLKGHRSPLQPPEGGVRPSCLREERLRGHAHSIRKDPVLQPPGARFGAEGSRRAISVHLPHQGLAQDQLAEILDLSKRGKFKVEASPSMGTRRPPSGGWPRNGAGHHHQP